MFKRSSATLVAALIATPALSAPSQEEMFETVKALQAEVRALRQELQQHKRARQVETAKPAKARSDWAAQSYQPGSVEVAQAPAWAGLYAGAAFGLGVSHTHGPNDSTTASFSSNFQPNFTFSTTFRSVSTQSIHETASPTAAAISGMIGYDYELGSNIVGGFQGDGTLWQRASNARHGEHAICFCEHFSPWESAGVQSVFPICIRQSRDNQCGLASLSLRLRTTLRQHVAGEV